MTTTEGCMEVTIGGVDGGNDFRGRDGLTVEADGEAIWGNVTVDVTKNKVSYWCLI